MKPAQTEPSALVTGLYGSGIEISVDPSTAPCMTFNLVGPRSYGATATSVVNVELPASDQATEMGAQA